MKRKIIALILSIITILSISSMLAITAFASGEGTIVSGTTTMSAANKNTLICSGLLKCYPDKTYSKFMLKDTSTVNKMNVWVMTTKDVWMSEKHLVYPNGNQYTIYYYTGQTFPTGANVCIWGEQANISTKKATYIAYSY